MTFEDFLESLYGRLRRPVPRGAGVPPELAPLGDYRRLATLLAQAHVFLVDIDIDIDDAEFIRTIGRDAMQDLQSTLPLPFDNFAIRKQGERGQWIFSWILRIERHLPPNTLPPDDLRDALFLWHTSSELSDLQPVFNSGIVWSHVGGPELRIEVTEASLERFRQARGCSLAEVKNDVMVVATAAMLEISAISHPANHIVERTPNLTPREARRVAAGEPRPARKPSNRPSRRESDHPSRPRHSRTPTAES